MIENHYDYCVEIHSKEDGLIAKCRMNIDWAPAVEDALWRGICLGVLDAFHPDGDIAIEPSFDPELQAPYIAGFSIRLPIANHPFSVEFNSQYFWMQLYPLTSLLHQQNQSGDKNAYYYQFFAMKKSSFVETETKSSIKIKALEPAFSMISIDLQSYREKSESVDNPQKEFPVFIRRTVLDECIEQSKEAGSLEIGGVLLGSVGKDKDETFLEITHQIPVQSPGTLNKLEFKPETWEYMRWKVQQRGVQGDWIGWWHTHSYLKDVCHKCEKYKTNSCHAGSLFFSTDDYAVQRTVFPRAYSVALVIGESPCAGLQYGLWGWRKGLMERRGFYVLDSNA
ncbi:MAG: hypothetical protein JXR73_21330 [Candidatus Omnitrophica bacterium]|nr:hypothetical protein [Candidatus Omnitrophota bacterium]